jgi:shikimate kinase
MIVIIGLPGSGKTHLAKTLDGVYDDFLFDNYKGKLIRDLKAGKRVCAVYLK